MKQIEIPLSDLGKAHQRIHRAEPGAHGQVARVFFFHTHDQVLPVRNIGRFGSRVHFFEVLQSFEALFAHVDADHVEHFAR